MSSSKLLRKLTTIASLSSSAVLIGSGYCYFKNEEKFFSNVLMPAIRLLDAETAHEIAVKACKLKIALPFVTYKDPESLNTHLGNIFITNPIGIAAGFDKNGEAIEGLNQLGFGFVEIGSVTPFYQAGNEKPRVFRLEEDDAVINRYGFNSDGHEKVWHRLQQLRTSRRYGGVIGVNLGKNKSTENDVKDYVEGVKVFAPVADYLVINISSPNTPGLRAMQQKDSLRNLLTEVLKTNRSLDLPKPIFLKLSPDLRSDELKDICKIITRKDCKVDGLIISNTTIDRSMVLHSQCQTESGGLSGKPLKEKSTKMIEDVYKLTNGKVTIIGVGGISNGEDAFEKILAGASAVQIYTSFIYQGPPLVTKIKRELSEKLNEHGYRNVQEAVGKGVTKDKRWYSF